MDILLIINDTLEAEELLAIRRRLKGLSVMAETDFEVVKEKLAGNQYKLVIFLTGEESLPDSWNVDDMNNGPVMVILKVSKDNLPMFYSYLDSIGVISETSLNRSKEKGADPLLNESLAYIEENIYENDLSLEKAASSIYFSRCHYSRVFKQNFGIGFKQYVMNKRIEQAKLLLKKGESVTETCYSVGYGDLTHFSRVFKRKIGVNPSVYRKEMLNQKCS